MKVEYTRQLIKHDKVKMFAVLSLATNIIHYEVVEGKHVFSYRMKEKAEKKYIELNKL